jgi:hypothetical protein
VALLWPTGLRKLVRVVDTLKGEDGAIRLGAVDYLVKPFEAGKHADMDPNNSPRSSFARTAQGRPRLTRSTEGPNLSATRHGSDASCLVPYQEPALRPPKSGAYYARLASNWRWHAPCRRASGFVIA